MKRAAFFHALCAIGLFLSLPLSAALSREPSLFSFGIGGWEIFHPYKRCWQAQVEYQSGYAWRHIHPVVSAFITEQRALYASLGLAYEQRLWRYFYFTPSFSAGVYIKNQGKEMGSPLEFRSALALSALLPNRYRVGVQLYHISNAGVGFKNPGAESLIFFVQKSLYR